MQPSSQRVNRVVKVWWLTAGAILVVLQMCEREDRCQLAVESNFSCLICLLWLHTNPSTFLLRPRPFLVSPDHAPLPQHKVFEFLVVRLVSFCGQPGSTQRRIMPTISWQQDVHHSEKKRENDLSNFSGCAAVRVHLIQSEFPLAQPTFACACFPDPADWWAWPSAWCVVWDHLPAAQICGSVASSLTPKPRGELRSDSRSDKSKAILT